MNLEDTDATFAQVFGSLPDSVKVYPTENYYYFKIFANGGDIWGNIRLDSVDREQGLVSFAYFYVNPNRTNLYYGEEPSWHKMYSAKDGVSLTKVDPLTYDMGFRGKTVRFHLNNIEQKLPADMKLHPGEELAARLCDESGFQFYLLFNRTNNSMYYVLDESVPAPDRLRPFGKGVLVGQLSEFAFYDEPDMNRRILFGVGERNVERNNYYDGPFDQLADNFVDPAKFQAQLELAYPHFKGKVRGRGDFVDEQGNRRPVRISVSPYITYTDMKDLWSQVAECQRLYGTSPDLVNCVASEKRRYFSAQAH